MTFCTCAVISAPLFAAAFAEASETVAWAAVALTLAGIVTAASVRPIEEAVMSAQQDWVEFATPRTTAQRLQALGSQKLYATLGVTAYTLVTSSALQLTASSLGDLMFSVVVCAAA